MIKHTRLINVNIKDAQTLPSPNQVKKQLPFSRKGLNFVLKSRQALQNILDDKDKRLFMVIGPCSIHDPKLAIEYAKRLKKLAEKVEDEIMIIMRVYFEKPRTTVGWKGLVNDPYLDDSFHVEKGIKIARKLLLKLCAMQLPTGTEALDPIMPQYLSELITWTAIGARTTESQTHREMSSGLSTPVGFKNGTDGSISVAINAMESVKAPHHFLGINQAGRISKFTTAGNQYAHIVLRGGGGKPNYLPKDIKKAEKLLRENKLREKIVVDCSHANSNKKHDRQPLVLKNCMEQINKGNQSIVGFMIESHLKAGNQKLIHPKKLKHGISITDACVDWKTTEKMVLEAQKVMKKIKK